MFAKPKNTYTYIDQESDEGKTYLEENKQEAFYNRQNVGRSVLPGTINDVIYYGGYASASGKINTILNSFTPVASITAPPGISKIRYLYVLATQTVAHVFHILVPRG
jgi:hypothetical protein